MENPISASDVPAILKYTRNVYYIGNLELACVKPGEITFYNLDGEEIEKEPKVIEWDAEAAEKAGFEHFMMKEIHEQPKAVADTLNSVIREGRLDLTEIGLDDERIRSISQVLYRGLRLCLPCGNGCTVCDRGSCRSSGACGACFGVPLPEAASGS